MILVKFEGPAIKGTSAVEGFADWIEFGSYSLNVARHIQVQGKDRELGGSHVSEMLLTKGADVTSPEFFIQALKGTSFDKITIALIQPAGAGKKTEVLVKYELADGIVSSFSTQGVANSRPEEHVSINYTAISYTYDPHDGTKKTVAVTKKYNLLTQKSE